MAYEEQINELKSRITILEIEVEEQKGEVQDARKAQIEAKEQLAHKEGIPYVTRMLHIWTNLQDEPLRKPSSSFW